MSTTRSILANHRWEDQPAYLLMHRVTNRVPFAQIGVKGVNGKWRRITFKVDSGADLTLIQKDWCEPLGITYENGIPASFGVANSDSFDTYVHYLDIRIGRRVLHQVPIAFTERRRDYQLLGRMGIFERVNVEFDSTQQHTSFSV